MLDFTGRMEALVADIVRRLPAFEHIDPDRLLLAVSRARQGGLSGTFARIYPLRFESGVSRWTRRVGRTLQTYEMPPVVHEGREILYIITFLLPRFQNLPFDAKLATVIHELYHVGPTCDGDIRRLPGKNFAHGPSRELYDRRMAALAAEYLQRGADRRLTEFLEHDFRTLERRYGGVTGLRISPPVPRLVATEPVPRRSRPRVATPAPPPGERGTCGPQVPTEPPGRQLSLPFPRAHRAPTPPAVGKAGSAERREPAGKVSRAGPEEGSHPSAPPWRAPIGRREAPGRGCADDPSRAAVRIHPSVPRPLPSARRGPRRRGT